MIRTIQINARLKPYVLTSLVILFSLLFYYFLNFLLLREIRYKHIVTLLNNPTMPSDVPTSAPHARNIAMLKNSDNAEHHFALAEFFSKFIITHRNTTHKNASLPVNVAETEALNHYKMAITINPLLSKYHVSFAEYVDLIYRERWSGDKYNPLIKGIITHHFESGARLNKKWDHPYRAYGSWLFALAKSEEVCSSDALLKQTLDIAVPVYKEAIERNHSLFTEGMEKYNVFTNNYHELKKIIPETPQLYYQFAKYLQGKGLWETNEGNFYNDIQLQAERFPLYKAIVEYLCQKKRFIEGVHLLKEYLKFSPQDVNAHLWLSNILFYNMQNKDEAIKEMELALKLNAEDTDVLFSYSKMLVACEEYNNSVEILSKVLSRDAKRHEAYFLAAQSYEKLLEMKKAEEFYEKAISLNPGSTEYKKRLARLRIGLKIDRDNSHRD